MSEIDHELCRYLLRDEAMRAAEDAAAVPSIQHRDLPEVVAALTERVARLEAVMPKSVSVSDAEGPENKGDTMPSEGLRTERVTLEITHGINSRPVELATWVRSAVSRKLHTGESVRVFEWTKRGRLPDMVARLTAERDAAIRERDEALLVLPACCGRLSDAAATVVQERDHARSRVAELLTDCETFERAVLALQGQLDLALARVAELEAAAPPRGWLTAEEREVVSGVRDHLEATGQLAYSDIVALDAILARETPPKVKVPHLDDLESDERPVWESACHEWIAAIRAAGGEVEG